MIITYTVGVDSTKEEACGEFEYACRRNDYNPTKEEIRIACYVGYDFSLVVNFDTETGNFEVSQINYGNDIYEKRD